jgi:hypothetical protein
METWKFFALFVMSLSLLTEHSSANPVDLSAPGGELGSANPKGYLEIWREIDGVGLQLGKGSYLPFRYKFSSDPSIGGILGPGFYLPMFEARNVLIREQVMRAYLPCGKGLYFWRDTVDPNKFLTPDKEWTGYITGVDGEDFTVWRDDGWKVLYHKSRLTSITSDDKNTFTWSYDNGGGATVSENGRSIITMEPNVAGRVAAFVFDGKRYEVEYAERPVTEMLMGQVAIKELDQALTSFKYPDATTDTFKFVLTPARVPTLTFNDKDKHQTLYTWDAASNYIATETGPQGDWTYTIGAATQDFGVPPISRTSSEGKTEKIAVDNKMGTYTSTAADGVITVTHVFETPGPLYHLVHKVEKMEGKTTKTIFHASYDEDGRLIRSIDENGFVNTFSYKANGDVVKGPRLPPSDPDSLAALKTTEATLLSRVNISISSEAKCERLQDLAFFYIFKMGDCQKALSLVPLETNRLDACDIQIAATCNNPFLSDNQKADQLDKLVDLYPERKLNLQSLVKLHREAGLETNNNRSN